MRKTQTMKKILIAIIIVLSIFLISVYQIYNDTNENRKIVSNKNIVDIKVDINKFISKLDISKFYSANFIELETTKKSLIGKINKAIIHDKFIYILDQGIARKLYKFNINGKFIKSIGKQGKGPGEYNFISDFDIKNEIIYISSQQNNKMILFDTDGNHITDVKFDDYIGMGFSVLNDGSFVVKNNDGSNKAVIFYDCKGKTINKISNHQNLFRYSNEYMFSKFKNELFIFFALNDTVFQLDEKKYNLEPNVYFDFGTRAFPLDKINTNSDVIKYYDDKKYMHLNLFYPSSKYYFCSIYSRVYLYYLIITKKEKDVYYSNTINYKKFPLGKIVGSTNQGPILSWNPSIVPILKTKHNKVFDFLPLNSQVANINSNPSIVILSEK